MRIVPSESFTSIIESIFLSSWPGYPETVISSPFFILSFVHPFLANHTTGDPLYSATQLKTLSDLALEAESLFPKGKEYWSTEQLRGEIRAFAHKKGFSISTVGSKFTCSRCATPKCDLNKRAKKQPLPSEKQRNRSSTTRVGCSFQITCSYVNYKNKIEDRRVVITKSSNYSHSNGCFPCRNQLVVEKRKAGTITCAIHETQIKAILAVMASGERVSAPMLRQMVRPLYPKGTSLDSGLLFNFRLKIKRMLAKGIVDLEAHTVTESEEQRLLSAQDADKVNSPAFLTESFIQFQDLLGEALSDENDVQQITKYLTSLADCDPTFSFRIGRSADGSVTGFAWQTGVMRRDFELFGDVLFVDAQGRSKNNKGWPINTIAMLDGERKVCLPIEGITIGESIDSYAWLIQSAAAMAPGCKLSDIKVIFGDGILSGERLLSKLGIQSSCKIMLDHHHLLSEDIGSWPKEFGLQLFATLKQDLTAMVKSPAPEVYDAALGRVRHQLSTNAKFASYLETSIHQQRHMFANHITKTYPGNMFLQGNTPAEANHSSIEFRLGPLVLAPVELIRALIKRHSDISAERNLSLHSTHYQAMGKALKIADPQLAAATKTLSSWGLSQFEQSLKLSRSLVQVGTENTALVFSDGVVVDDGAVKCSCRAGTAFPGTQCKHLLLSAEGFSLDHWSTRWRQRTELGSSSNVGQEANLVQQTIDEDGDEDGDDQLSTGDFGFSQDSCSEMGGDDILMGNSNAHLGLRDLMDVTRDLAFSIQKIRDKQKQNLIVGAVMKLTDIAKGNMDQISNQSLEEVLENRLSLFTRNMASQPMFSQEEDKENSVMRNAAPTGSSGGGRKRSANERTRNTMRSSQKRPETCTLCLAQGHRAGPKCPLVTSHGARNVGYREVEAFCSKLGNPAHFVMEPRPDKKTKQIIKEWIAGDPSIPKTAHHMVIKRSYYNSKKVEQVTTNILEVHLLEAGGLPLQDYCPSYFQAHKVGQWITQHCNYKGRKKHVLSALLDASLSMSQEV